jgi:hypothetical protein
MSIHSILRASVGLAEVSFNVRKKAIILPLLHQEISFPSYRAFPEH